MSRPAKLALAAIAVVLVIVAGTAFAHEPGDFGQNVGGFSLGVATGAAPLPASTFQTKPRLVWPTLDTAKTRGPRRMRP
jgi:hypothetical protein